MGEVPIFKPYMLRCLTYIEALQAMRHTGCAIRRQHWCSPVVVYEGTRLILDNEDHREPWKPTWEDRKAHDWEMTPAADGGESRTPSPNGGSPPAGNDRQREANKTDGPSERLTVTFPKVRSFTWCGEHQPAPAIPDAVRSGGVN